MSIILIALIFSINTSTDTNINIPMQDSLGIKMERHSFDSLVMETIKKFDKDPTIDASIGDYLMFIRVENTIHFFRLLNTDKNYLKISDLFATKYLEKIVKATEAKLAKGMSYYSAKYDIQIGGQPTPNNFYRLTNNTNN